MSAVACLAEAEIINIKNYYPITKNVSDLKMSLNSDGDADVGLVESLIKLLSFIAKHRERL